MDLDIKFDPSGYEKADVVAKILGLGLRRVQQLTQEGILPTEPTQSGRRYALADTVHRYIEHLNKKSQNTKANDNLIQLKEKKLKADIALRESQGELHRLKTSIANGEYISCDEIRMDYGRFFLEFKKMATAIPARACSAFAGQLEPSEVRRIEREMSKEIAFLLNSFVVAAVEEAGAST